MDYITYLLISFGLFFIGLLGIFLNKKSIILILMSVELMLLSINFSLLLTSSYIDDSFGQILALFILTVAAAESAIGLAILVAYYRVRNTIAVEDVSMLRA